VRTALSVPIADRHGRHSGISRQRRRSHAVSRKERFPDRTEKDCFRKFNCSVPARNAMVYTKSPAEFIQALGLREVDAGANVLVASGASDVAFTRTAEREGMVTVAPSQAAVDLLTGPGRNPAEAEELLDWMEVNESEWRA
jgi:hypothetical protein